MVETVSAKFHGILAKAISTKQSHRSKPWSVDYDNEKDNFDAVHYGTVILTFSLTHQLENGHYAKLGGGWSYTDKMAIDAVLRHVFDVHGSRITRLSENFVNSNKFYTKQHYAIFDSNQHGQILAIEKDPAQKTLYAFQPFRSKRHVQIQKLKVRRVQELAILEKQIALEIKAQLEYLKTHERANITLTSEGFKVVLNDTVILIAWNGDVFDLNAKERVCVQIDTQQNFTSAQELGLTPLDVTLSKALGIALKPTVLNEGIHTQASNTLNGKLPSIVEVLREADCYEATCKIDAAISGLEDVQETVYEQKRRRESFKTKLRHATHGHFFRRNEQSQDFDIETLIGLGIKREYVVEWCALRDSLKPYAQNDQNWLKCGD